MLPGAKNHVIYVGVRKPRRISRLPRGPILGVHCSTLAAQKVTKPRNLRSFLCSPAPKPCNLRGSRRQAPKRLFEAGATRPEGNKTRGDQKETWQEETQGQRRRCPRRTILPYTFPQTDKRSFGAAEPEIS